MARLADNGKSDWNVSYQSGFELNLVGHWIQYWSKMDIVDLDWFNNESRLKTVTFQSGFSTWIKAGSVMLGNKFLPGA